MVTSALPDHDASLALYRQMLTIRRCEELGVTLCTVGPAPVGLRGSKEEFIEWIESFGESVIPKV